MSLISSPVNSVTMAKNLEVPVLRLQHLLGRIEDERGLPIRKRQNVAHGPLAAVDENGCGLLKGQEAPLPERAAAIDGKNEVLVGGTDLISPAYVRIALLQPVTNPRF